MGCTGRARRPIPLQRPCVMQARARTGGATSPRRRTSCRRQARFQPPAPDAWRHPQPLARARGSVPFWAFCPGTQGWGPLRQRAPILSRLGWAPPGQHALATRLTCRDWWPRAGVGAVVLLPQDWGRGGRRCRRVRRTLGRRPSRRAPRCPFSPSRRQARYQPPAPGTWRHPQPLARARGSVPFWPFCAGTQGRGPLRQRAPSLSRLGCSPPG